jgi:hypothetical protein
MLSWSKRVVLLGASWLVVGASSVQALEIRYEAIDLQDLVLGEDRWQYRYHLDGFPFGADHGFAVLFDETLYAQLDDPPPTVNPDWDVITLQPDPNLPDPGRYDALALVVAPSVADVFAVDFVWIGQGAPASQAFVVFDPSFQTIEFGSTTLIPEPATAVLFAYGIASLTARRRCGKTTRSP